MSVQVNVNQTNAAIVLGNYAGIGDYSGISFNATGSVNQSDWHLNHFMQKIEITLTNNSVRCNLFQINYCSKNKEIEVHVATGGSQLMKNTKLTNTYQASSPTEMNLQPNNANAILNISFIVYAYSDTNSDDDTILQCGNPGGDVPVYSIKEKDMVDPNPDVKKGSILVGN